MKEALERRGDSTTCPVAVIIRDGKVLLGLRHYTPDKWKTISVWTPPGGRCDEGETVEITLRREVEEETGIQSLEILKYISEVSGAKEGDYVPMFLCKTREDAVLMEPEKFSDWKWFGKNDFPKDFINDKARPYFLELLK